MAEAVFSGPKLYKGTAGCEAERPLCGKQRSEAHPKQGAEEAQRRTATMLRAWGRGKTANLRQFANRNGGLRRFYLPINLYYHSAANGLPPSLTA